MYQVKIDVEDAGAFRAITDQMVVPDLVEQGASSHGRYLYGMVRGAAVQHANKRLLHQAAHLLRSNAMGPPWPDQVTGAMPGFQHLAYGFLQVISFMGHLGGVAQEHGHGGDSAQRVGNPFPGNVRSRTVYRFIKIDLAA